MFSLTLLLAAVAMEPWKDPTKSTVERVDNLISLLSLDEKVCIFEQRFKRDTLIAVIAERVCCTHVRKGASSLI